MNVVNDIINTFKKDKKMLIILIIVVALLLFVVISNVSKKDDSSGKAVNGNFFKTSSTLLNSDTYTGTVYADIGGTNMEFEVKKELENYSVSLSIPTKNLNFGEVFVIYNDVIYLKQDVSSSSSNWITITRNTEVKKTATLLDTIISGIKQANVSTTADNEYSGIATTSSEEWESFFSSIETAITENKELLGENTTNPTEVSAILSTFSTYLKQLAETDTVANSLSINIKQNVPEDKSSAIQYVGTFEAAIDLTLMPKFVDTENFDSNQLRISGTYDFTNASASIKKPSGANQPIQADSLSDILSNTWSKIFSKAKYISYNEVVVGKDAVSNKVNLGEVTEYTVYNFNAEGVESATLTITTTNPDLIKLYKDKYKDTKDIVETENGEYILSVESTIESLKTINKIATTPEELGAYLKSSKGGDILV